MGAELRFDVLGPLRGSADGVALRLPGSAVVRRLLGVLLLAHEPLSAERLTRVVWGDRVDEVSRGSLHVGISRLREWLSAQTGGQIAVAHEGPGYLLTADPQTIDVRRFRRVVADAVATLDDDRRRVLLAAAMVLPRGPVLADLTGLDRDDSLITTIEDDVRQTALSFATLAIAAGTAAEAIGPLQMLAAGRPFDEPVHARLIDVLAAAGRPAEALVQYEGLRERLAEHLGVDPSSEAQRAHLAVLDTDQNGSTGESGPARPAPVARATPGQLPPDLPDFTGNQRAVAAVVEALTSTPPRGGSPVVVVTGQGGVGKTSLAVHVAHEVAADFPDGQLFVSLGGTRTQPVHPEDAIRRVLRSLGDDTDTPPADLEDCVSRYRDLLDGRRLLIVLDDAAGAAQVRPFLPGGSGSAVLVSTRGRLTTLAAVRHLDLDVMVNAEATALLAGIVGAERVAAEPEAAATLVHQCARLPLALRVVGARLAARPHWPLARLVERMSNERRRLDELAIDDLAVRAVLVVGYRGLDPQAARALRAIAYLDPPDVAAWTVGALLGVGLPEAEDVVEQLLDMRLVEVSASGPATRYRMHDLVRLYGQERALAEDTETELREGVVRALSLGLHQVELRSEQLAIAVPRLYRLPVRVDQTLVDPALSTTAEWFDAEEPGLVAAIERAAALKLDDLACALADALVYASFAVHNNFAGWNRAHQAALGVARSTGNQRAEAVFECGLGQLRYKEDRFAEAKQYFDRALQLFRQVQDDRGEIVATNGLGTVCRELGEHDIALPLHHRAVSRLEALGDQEGAAHAHYGLGYMHRELGDDDRAITHLNQAIELYRRVGHVRGEATAVRGLGLVHRARGELDQAETLCARAHLMATTAPDRLLSCYTGQALAKVWIRQQRPERAAEPLAEMLVTSLGLRDRLGAALIRRTIGEMHLAAGRPQEALAFLIEAEDGWKELDHQLWQARTLRDIGAAHAALGDALAAHRSWATAARTLEKIGTRERGELTAWRLAWGCSCDPEELDGDAHSHRW
jgi:DNA-binding SARP family transcriptional activator/tetratricopeptide (TPR) repeat protein